MTELETTIPARREEKREALERFWEAQDAIENETEMVAYDPLTEYGYTLPVAWRQGIASWEFGDTRQRLVALPARMRAALMLRSQDLTFEAVGAILRITRERATSIYHEGRRRLEWSKPHAKGPKPEIGMGKMEYLPIPDLKPSRGGGMTVASPTKPKKPKPRIKRSEWRWNPSTFKKPPSKPIPMVWVLPDKSICCPESVAVRICKRARALGMIRICTGKWASQFPKTRIRNIEFFILEPAYGHTERTFSVKVTLWKK